MATTAEEYARDGQDAQRRAASSGNNSTDADNKRERYEAAKNEVDQNFTAAKNALDTFKQKDVSAEETAQETVLQGAYVSISDALAMVDAERQSDKNIREAKLEMLKAGGRMAWYKTKDMVSQVANDTVGLGSAIIRGIGVKGALIGTGLGVIGSVANNGEGLWAAIAGAVDRAGASYDLLEQMNPTDPDTEEKYVEGMASSDDVKEYYADQATPTEPDSGVDPDVDVKDPIYPDEQMQEEDGYAYNESDDVFNLTESERNEMFDRMSVGDIRETVMGYVQDTLGNVAEDLENNEGILGSAVHALNAVGLVSDQRVEQLGEYVSKLYASFDKSHEEDEQENDGDQYV